MRIRKFLGKYLDKATTVIVGAFCIVTLASLAYFSCDNSKGRNQYSSEPPKIERFHESNLPLMIESNGTKRGR